MNKVRKWQHKLLAQFFSCQGSCQSVLCPCGFPKSALCLCLVCQCLLDSLQHRSTRLAWFCIWAPWGYQQFPSCNPTLYFFRLLVIVYPIYDTMCLHIVLQVYHKCELPGGDTADLRFAYRFSLSPPPQFEGPHFESVRPSANRIDRRICLRLPSLNLRFVMTVPRSVKRSLEVSI